MWLLLAPALGRWLRSPLPPPRRPSSGQPSDGRAERGKCTVASPGSGQAQATPPRRLMIGRLNNRACATGKTSEELTAREVIGCYGNPTSTRRVTMRLSPPHRWGNMGKKPKTGSCPGELPMAADCCRVEARVLRMQCCALSQILCLLWCHKVRYSVRKNPPLIPNLRWTSYSTLQYTNTIRMSPYVNLGPEIGPKTERVVT